MLKKYLILILFLFFFTASLKSNDFDDLIELYDQQILSEDALYNSLKKMNQEFNSDQFDKLFNLFINTVISKDDLLTALRKKTSDNESVTIKKPLSNTLIKKFNFTSCKGNSDTCSIMNKFFVEYEMNNNETLEEKLTTDWNVEIMSIKDDANIFDSSIPFIEA